MEALCQSPHSALCTFSLWLWKYFPKQCEPFQQITKPKRGSSEPPIYSQLFRSMVGWGLVAGI